MALEGKYTYKGIDLAKAYVMITNVNYNTNININGVLNFQI